VSDKDEKTKEKSRGGGSVERFVWISEQTATFALYIIN
jgi:hypothetical protein